MARPRASLGFVPGGGGTQAHSDVPEGFWAPPYPRRAHRAASSWAVVCSVSREGSGKLIRGEREAR